MPGGEAAELEVLWSGMLPARDSSPKHVVCSLRTLTVVETERWMNGASAEEGSSGSAEESQIGAATRAQVGREVASQLGVGFLVWMVFGSGNVPFGQSEVLGLQFHRLCKVPPDISAYGRYLILHFRFGVMHMI